MSRRLLVLAAVATLAALAAVPDGLALSRQQANAIAMRELKPQAQRGRIALFALPRALSATQSIAAASPSRLGLKARKRGLKPLGRKAWLFWLDRAYGAQFQHPSTMLVIDDGSGRVLVRRALTYYPLVDGLRPAFLRSPAAYSSNRHRIYTNVRFSARSTAAAFVPLARSELPANAFADDCLIMIGAWHDPLFERNFFDLQGFARSVGLRAFWATSSGPARVRPNGEPHGSALITSVNQLVAEPNNCKDVMIYASGHGTGPTGTVSIMIGESTRGRKVVHPATIETILSMHPKITFKIKIDGCYSGRFAKPALTGKPNLTVLETSSAADEVSWADALGAPRSEPKQPGRNEFTHANLVGMSRFVASAAEVTAAVRTGNSLLARMLARAFELGADADGARRLNRTHPVLHTNFPPGVQVTVWWYHPPGGQASYLCFEWVAPGGSILNINFQAPVFGGGGGTLTVPGGPGPKRGTSAFRIFFAGRYTGTVAARLPDGTVLQQVFRVDVTSAQGGPPCGE